MYQPLADLLRPKNLDEVYGQEYILGEGAILRRLIDSGNIPNLIFYGPSGTGKTTQAKLWRTHRGAEIICNDRTLVRDGQTYGFPMDGSEPVCSGKILPLGAVVCLAQASENQIRRLRPGEALAALMPQVVFDSWDSRSSRLASEQLIELIRRRPVYQLCCTPDQQAVECLEACLRKDGILE